jgi:hypothetical protein
MFLSYLMLAVALMLSAVAAFYSIVGLTAIFAAAVVPIIIMGTILEIAKITVTIWLHEYWQKCRWLMKAYLVPAVFTLMVITSMGIFGFLSKAHLDQVVPTGDVQAQVALIDEKISNERDTIANARTLLGQLDKAVTDISNSPDREVNGRVISSAERALQVRRQQARDRAALTKTIEESQARIVVLQEEKAPFARDLRKIEAEVGPVKYIAALIYGDNPDANLLEKAVRWVIIILVAVFDPLAIMMLLAATESMKWTRQDRTYQSQKETPDERSHGSESSAIPTMVGSSGPETQARTESDQPPDHHPPAAVESDTGDNLSLRSDGTIDNEPREHDRHLGLETGPGNTVYVDWYVDQDQKTQIETPKHPQDEHDIPILENEETWAQRVIDEHEAEKAAMREWKKVHPETTIKEQRRLVASGVLDDLPWRVGLEADNEGRASQVRGFGIEFPRQASKGDQFLRVDMMPSRLYKFNGNKWIEVEKQLSDQYAYDEAYIDYLIAKIASGEYDADLLSEAEQDQIRQRLVLTQKGTSDS